MALLFHSLHQISLFPKLRRVDKRFVKNGKIKTEVYAYVEEIDIYNCLQGIDATEPPQMANVLLKKKTSFF